MRIPALLLALGIGAPVQAADQEVFNFFDQSTNATNEEEEQAITNAFECYDLSSDHDQAVCLDPVVGLLHDQMERQYSARFAATPLSRQEELRRKHNKWRVDTRIRCGQDVTCARISIQEHLLFLHQAPIIYRRDLVLKQGEAPLRIGVTGRKTQDGYLLHSLLLFEVNSHGKEAVKQRTDFFRLMRSNHFELLHPRPGPYLLDANFDGWMDLVFFTGERARDISRIYFIHQPDDGLFRTDGLLNAIANPVFIAEHQLVSSPWEGDGQYGIDYYRFKNNKLQRDLRVVYSWSEEAGKVNMTTFSNRTGKMKAIDERSLSVEQVGELPELYTTPEQSNAAAQSETNAQP